MLEEIRPGVEFREQFRRADFSKVSPGIVEQTDVDRTLQQRRAGIN